MKNGSTAVGIESLFARRPLTRVLARRPTRRAIPTPRRIAYRLAPNANWGNRTMRAVWYERQGPANEVIITGEVPTPEPGTGQVRVRLEASGVNPSDTYRRRGAVPAEYPRGIPKSQGAGGIEQGCAGV